MTLRSTISTPEGKRVYVRRLFATIADRYDFITRVLSYGQDERWKRRLIRLAHIQESDRVLDLACGTGDLLFAAAVHAKSAVGLDVTHRMLQLATQRKASGASHGTPSRRRDGGPAGSLPRADLPPSPRLRRPAEALAEAGTRSAPQAKNVMFITGDMLALPFRASRFDVVTTGYGLRNVPDLPSAIGEIYRVLAPGGRLLSLDFNRPDNRVVRGAYLTYLTVVGSALGFLLHGDPDTYRYIPESIRQYPGAAGVARLLEQSGFADVRVVTVLSGLMAIHVACKT